VNSNVVRVSVRGTLHVAMPESADATLTLYYAPRTRAFTALWLLEEMQLPYRLESFALNSGRHKAPEFLAQNPMGKVPVVVDGRTPVSEIGAIAIYLGDRFPEAGLAPKIGDPRRADYLRWIVFQSGVIEPAYAEHFAKATPNPTSHAWGSFDQMLAVMKDGVKRGPFLLGEQFTIADVLVASTLRFGLMFGILDKQGVLADYVGRATARPGFARANAIQERETARLAAP
jgi:glutathione S-transferase